MLKVTYTRICDACAGEIGAETHSITGSDTPLPRPSRFGASPGGWFYELCPDCFEPLKEPLRAIAQAGLVKKGAV